MSKGKWLDELDEVLAKVDDYLDEIKNLTAQRERLREALEELTTAAETECRHDTVLRKALSPYCDAARAVLQEAKDD